VLPGEAQASPGGPTPDVAAAEATLERAAEQLREALRSLPSFAPLDDRNRRISIVVRRTGSGTAVASR
jgi:hypothetical protein